MNKVVNSNYLEDLITHIKDLSNELDEVIGVGSYQDKVHTKLMKLKSDLVKFRATGKEINFKELEILDIELIERSDRLDNHITNMLNNEYYIKLLERVTNQIINR